MANIFKFKINDSVYEFEDTYVRNSNFSGDYNDLENIPVIPENMSELTNDQNYITASDIDDLKASYIEPQIAATNSKLQELDKQLDSKLDNSLYTAKFALSETTAKTIDPVVEDSHNDNTISIGINGKTYQNLFGRNPVIHPTVTDNGDGTVTVPSTVVTYTPIVANNNALLKPKTTYTFIVEILSNDTSDEKLKVQIGGSTTPNAVFITDLTKGVKIIKTTTSSTLDNNILTLTRIKNANTPDGSTISLKMPVLLEGDYTSTALSGIPSSFNDICSFGDRGQVAIRSTGKNLLSKARRLYGSYTSGRVFIKNYDNVVLPYSPTYETDGLIYYINCKKGETYTLSVTNPNNNAAIGIAEYSTLQDGRSVDKRLGYAGITKSSSVKYTCVSNGILLCLIAGQWTNGTTTLHTCTESELMQLEVGSTATEYEENTESTQTIILNEPLRSLRDGTCDEIIGDKIIRRVGVFPLYKGTFGCNDRYAGIKDNTSIFRYNNVDLFTKGKSNSFTNALPWANRCWNDDIESFGHVENSLDLRVSYANLGVTNTATNEEKQAALKNWLNQNKDIVLYHELATPYEESITPVVLTTYKMLTRFFMFDPIATEMSVEYVKEPNKTITNIKLTIAEQITELQEQVDKLELS